MENLLHALVEIAVFLETGLFLILAWFIKRLLNSLDARITKVEEWQEEHESCTKRHVETLTRLDESIKGLKEFLGNVNKSFSDFKDLMTKYMIERTRGRGAGD